MNALPVTNIELQNSASRETFIKSASKLGVELIVLEHKDVSQISDEILASFIDDVKSNGLSSAVLLPSDFIPSSAVSIEDASYDSSNNPVITVDGRYLASPASERWLTYLKHETERFIINIGVDVVIFNEPYYRHSLPGIQDKIYKVFSAAYSDYSYPSRKEHTLEFMQFQSFRKQIISDLYNNVSDYSKSIGSRKVGIKFEYNISEDLEQYNEITSFAQESENIDFIIAPHKSCCTSENKSVDSILEAYTHSGSKRIILELQDCESVDDFNLSICKGLFAAVEGFYFSKVQKELIESDQTAKLISFTGRLGEINCPIAFVFSDYGRTFNQTDFVAPLATELLINFKLHLRSFNSESLATDLEKNPDVTVLVLDERNPITAAKMILIKNWLKSDIKRSVIAFGNGKGYSADNPKPGNCYTSEAFPGLFELIGLKDGEIKTLKSDKPWRLEEISKVKRGTFLKDEMTLKGSDICDVRRVFGSRSISLYETQYLDEIIPVVSQRSEKTALYIFCGIEINKDTASFAAKAIAYALKETDMKMLCNNEIPLLCNTTKNNYFLYMNLSDKPIEAPLTKGRQDVWDSLKFRFIDNDEKIIVKPFELRIVRTMSKRSKVIDITGVCDVSRLADGAGRAEIEACIGKRSKVIVRAEPKVLNVDGRSVSVISSCDNELCEVSFANCQPGERKIQLKW